MKTSSCSRFQGSADSKMLESRVDVGAEMWEQSRCGSRDVGAEQMREDASSKVHPV